MAWWSRTEGLASEPKKSVPKGVFTQCDACSSAVSRAELEEAKWVCPSCGHHMRMPTSARVELILDQNTFVEHDESLRSVDPLGFVVDDKKYSDSLQARYARGGANSAYLAGEACIGGHPIEAGFFAFEFMGGSMGSVVGEKITRQFERSLTRRVPSVIFCASGGARMQEGALSLLQMAKTSAARAKLRKASIPYIAVLLHPTTGGVAASIAMLGDIIITEPGALIGFAGPRVIEQTIGETLPEGFQRAEFLLEHGMVDQVVARSDMRDRLIRFLQWFREA